MSLTKKQLGEKRRRKMDKRAALDARRDYLLHRYGSLVGDAVYRFERIFGNARIGKKPEDLVAAMKLADALSPARQEKAAVLSLPTTGSIHKKRRQDRAELQKRINDMPGDIK